MEPDKIYQNALKIILKEGRMVSKGAFEYEGPIAISQNDVPESKVLRAKGLLLSANLSWPESQKPSDDINTILEIKDLRPSLKEKINDIFFSPTYADEYAKSETVYLRTPEGISIYKPGPWESRLEELIDAGKPTPPSDPSSKRLWHYHGRYGPDDMV
jgi:hypothetical protein